MRVLLGTFADAVELAIPVVALVALVTAVRTLRRPRDRAWSATVGGGVLAAGLVMIAATTLLPSAVAGPATVNTTLLDSVRRYVHHGDGILIARNLGLNVLLFVPVGVGAALRWRRFVAVVALGAGLSALVEGLQWLLPLGRAVDVDDVLLNTVGTLVGAATVATARWVRRRSAREPRRSLRTAERSPT